MLPEISRRCTSCGAAVRAGARFCPQCGTAVAEGAAQGDASAAPSEEPVPPEPVAESPREAAPSTREVYASASESESPSGRGSESRVRGDGVRHAVPDTGEWLAAHEAGAGEAARPVAVDDAGVQLAPAAMPQQSQPAEDAAVEERRGRVARVREEARTRVENTRARVARVRDDARVAFEETPDDSGLRFVAVAVFLFALFLLLLFLSTTVLR